MYINGYAFDKQHLYLQGNVLRRQLRRGLLENVPFYLFYLLNHIHSKTEVGIKMIFPIFVVHVPLSAIFCILLLNHTASVSHL